MIEEHLNRIRSKEDESRSRLAAAEAEASELVEKARASGTSHLDDVQTECGELERSLMAAARRNADERIAALRAESAKKLAALAVLARKNQEKALEIIMREFHEGV